jgi:hypothetical protein
MKVAALSPFSAPIHLIVTLLVVGFSFIVNAQAPAEDDSLEKLSGRIEELSQQGKYREEIGMLKDEGRRRARGRVLNFGV